MCKINADERCLTRARYIIYDALFDFDGERLSEIDLQKSASKVIFRLLESECCTVWKSRLRHQIEHDFKPVHCIILLNHDSFT